MRNEEEMLNDIVNGDPDTPPQPDRFFTKLHNERIFKLNKSNSI
jgi:hypothetical protein